MLSRRNIPITGNYNSPRNAEILYREDERTRNVQVYSLAIHKRHSKTEALEAPIGHRTRKMQRTAKAAADFRRYVIEHSRNEY